MDRTLGQVLCEAQRRIWEYCDNASRTEYELQAAAVVAAHEAHKWRPMSECPECAREIIAAFQDSDGRWVQSIGHASILRDLPYYTHWQPAPEPPKEKEHGST